MESFADAAGDVPEYHAGDTQWTHYQWEATDAVQVPFAVRLRAGNLGDHLVKGLIAVDGVAAGASVAMYGSRSSDDGGSYAAHPEDLDVLNATFSCRDLDSFCRLDRLGLSVIGQQIHDDHAVLAWGVLDRDDWCHKCGCQGAPRDTVWRKLAHVPLGWRPTILHVRVRRYRCIGCGHVWRQDTTAAAAPRAKLSRHAVLWALKSVVINRLSIARVANGLGTSWHTANDAVLAAGRQLLINDPGRLDAMRVLFASEQHAEAEATWGGYQRIVAAYRHPDRNAAKATLSKIVDTISRGVPATLTELVTLGRTLKRRAADVLAYFDRPGTSNGPTEAIL